MKTFLHTLAIACSITFFSGNAFGQKKIAESEKAADLIKKNVAVLMLTDDDIHNSVVSDFYTTADGVTMLYLQQAYKNIPVYNRLQVAAFKNEKIISLSGERIPKISLKVNQPNAVALITPETAIRNAAAHLKLPEPQVLFQTSPAETDGNILRFSPAGISQQDMTVQALWTPVNENALLLSWQVYIVPTNSSDYWMVRINALTGEVIEKTNLTVSCQWERSGAVNLCANENPQPQATESVCSAASPLAISSANYRVIPYPAESPIHTGGAHAIRSNPWTAAPGNASTLAWNSNGTTDYIITRGNNVYAHEDRANNNSNNGLSDTSSTALPDLNYLQVPDYTQLATLRANQKFATTNLFYWNNVMHDISYQYGFDEVSGNFQSNNLSRGGAANDFVQADAQDGAGTNNANFGTPADGASPRMQMFLFNIGVPGKDGDLDNGVIAHEYTHGISNRLTGGPALATCLQNAEQMGEGWSDYFSLMVTTNWATATTSDGPLSRPIGNYVLNNAANGPGIRNYPYSTNLAINPLTYASLPGTGGQVHSMGEIWCSMLWDMTWNMIQVDGINSNFYNAANTIGNSAALKIVTEGMRLQPCSPGFIDGRNAILRADTILFGARYSCAIWNAFARRGLGVSASQGSSNNINDGVADFLSMTGLASAPFTVNKTQVGGNELMTYNTQITAGACAGINNYYITDTLPTNVTYVSGGSYNSSNRTVTFSPISLAPAASNNYMLTVRVNADAYYPPIQYVNETVPTTTISATWTTAGTVGSPWIASNAASHSAPNSFFAANGAAVADKRLATETGYPISGITTLSFWHSYNLETGFDGGVVEISTNGGSAWTDLGSLIISNGYNGVLSTLYANPIGGRSAFTGNSGGFVKTVVNLNSFSGQTVRFRFRLGTDNAVAATGWYVDDIELKSEAVVFNKTNVYDAGNVLQSAKSITTPVTSLVVPLTWGDFYAQKKQNRSLLTWTTLQEVNVLNFTVERSADGIGFTPVTTVPATGNSTGTQTYSAIDPQPLKGNNYYRILERDANGRSDLSEVRTLNFSDPAPVITISPNPAKDFITIAAPGISGVLNVTIINAVGQSVKTLTVRNQYGTYGLLGMSAGVYYVRMTGSGQTIVKKLVIE